MNSRCGLSYVLTRRMMLGWSSASRARTSERSRLRSKLAFSSTLTATSLPLIRSSALSDEVRRAVRTTAAAPRPSSPPRM
eukprot:scaffold6463_cov28-Tisochrysis_lutea.AAC.3